MREVPEARLQRNLGNGMIALPQQPLRFLDPQQVQVIAIGETGRLLKQPAQVMGADPKSRRDLGQGQCPRIMLVQIPYDRLRLRVKDRLRIR